MPPPMHEVSLVLVVDLVVIFCRTQNNIPVYLAPVPPAYLVLEDAPYIGRDYERK